MRSFIALLVIFAACSQAFHFSACINRAITNNKVNFLTAAPRFRMSTEEENSVQIVPVVPVDKNNVESAAAVTGGILGLVLGGPVLAAIFAAVANYVSKKEGESGEALRGLGKTVVESFNFLTKLNVKYNLTGKVTDTVGKAISSVETESEALQKVKGTYETVTSKITELNEEYDLVSKGKEVIASTAALSDVAIDKVLELNQKYDFVALTKKAAVTAVEKLKEQTGAATPESK
mmetsp:Transcript_8118/g.11422  ORF Transcript_8118/g.11422 Transcript_8118/m.11422 type:complete len:234 (-) Transcript_8118:181-882(-)